MNDLDDEKKVYCHFKVQLREIICTSEHKIARMYFFLPLETLSPLFVTSQTQQNKTNKQSKAYMNAKQVVEIHHCYFINTAIPLKYAAIRAATEIRM